jgi:hypothetical protein
MAKCKSCRGYGYYWICADAAGTERDVKKACGDCAHHRVDYCPASNHEWIATTENLMSDADRVTKLINDAIERNIDKSPLEITHAVVGAIYAAGLVIYRADKVIVK